MEPQIWVTLLGPPRDAVDTDDDEDKERVVEDFPDDLMYSIEVRGVVAVEADIMLYIV